MERRAVIVRGTVQGVGFRPFVCTLAQQLALDGFVRNIAGEVHIEIEGSRAVLDEFVHTVVSRPPALARIEHLAQRLVQPCGQRGFHIETSQCGAAGTIVVAPDTATCRECLAELFDSRDRRYRYPFLNCTNCGPRLTIVTAAPYDRERTTMRAFPMCPACRAEYENPANRRFHAEPIACPECGPQLRLCTPAGETVATDDPIADLVAALRRGQIGALKGLGGYHLACDASNDSSLRALRERKARDDKPFAIMVRTTDQAGRYCQMTTAERALLESRRRPIVLLRKAFAAENGTGSPRLAAAVAPGNPCLGVMLPYTPLHHLLMKAAGETPLVMTSGNRSDEPIAYREPEAFEQLCGIADVFLTHDREIHVRCDDSVARMIGPTESIVRRSRGLAPEPLSLPFEMPVPLLAVGGQLKDTFALAKDHQAVISHHIGDLDNLEAYRAFARDVDLYQELFEIQPEAVVCDAHPDYASARYARERAEREQIPVFAVQHHHAHIASCMVEHGLADPVIGVAFDGTGWGADGGIWGGEFLLADYAQYSRAAHLRYVPLPGGDRAAREPWRMAAAYLLDAGCDTDLIAQWTTPAGQKLVTQMITGKISSPATSSVGRLFDAVAAMLGVRGTATFEAQAAMELEGLAADVEPDGGYPFAILESSGEFESCEIDMRPTTRAIVEEIGRGIDRPRIARRFHSTVVEMLATTCMRLCRQHDRQNVVLSGGVFANALITEEATARLTSEGVHVFRHSLVPTNDGGLSLGQLAIGAAMLRGTPKCKLSNSAQQTPAPRDHHLESSEVARPD